MVVGCCAVVSTLPMGIVFPSTVSPIGTICYCYSCPILVQFSFELYKCICHSDLQIQSSKVEDDDDDDEMGYSKRSFRLTVSAMGVGNI